MYLVGKEALERSENPHMRDKASFIPDLPGLLKQSGRLQIVDGPTCPGFYEDRISFVFTDGHTPGQMHTVIRGSERSIIFAGDLVPGTPWVHLPITMGYDRSPEKLIDEKKALYQSIDTDSTWFFYTHDTETSCSRIEKNENGKYYASDFKDSLNSWSL